jgi:hypothetical protein
MKPHADQARLDDDVHPPGPALDEPVIVLTGARSGSTLVRLLLDAHPDLACPPETNIVKICAQLAGVFRVTGQGGAAGAGTWNGNACASSVRVAGRVRDTVGMVFGDYLVSRGKRRWCDKSIGTAAAAGWFAGLYPKARFICLYRHCMDVIHSGLEASPWGLMGYGFEQFAGLRSGNNVSALATYWTEHTSRILEFERANPDRCLRVHYERLVEEPERTAAQIFAFLDVADVPGISWRCFTAAGQDATDPAAAMGPGDHKIRATDKITSDSVGRGIRIPAELIPAFQLEVINRLLAELGYAQVDSAWRASACPPALLAGGSASRSQDAVAGACPASFGDEVVRSVLENIGEVFRTSVAAGLALGLPSTGLPGRDGRCAFGLVAYHPDVHRLARAWRVDLRERSVAEVGGIDAGIDADWLVTADVETWLGVLAGRANMASCLRAGTLRYVGLRDQDQQESQSPSDRLTQAAQTERRLTAVRELLGLAAYPEEPTGPEVPLLGGQRPGETEEPAEPMGVG